MTQAKHDFRVSADEARFLTELAAHDESLAGLLPLQEEEHGRAITIGLSRADAEQLRESLTAHLATVGFDKDYSTNERGRMLEKLIDMFYLD
jgi:hypothetical protein